MWLTEMKAASLAGVTFLNSEITLKCTERFGLNTPKIYEITLKTRNS